MIDFIIAIAWLVLTASALNKPDRWLGVRFLTLLAITAVWSGS